MKKSIGGLALVTLVMLAPAGLAQLEVGGSLLDNCARIDGLRNSGDMPGARDAAQLCLQGIEQEIAGELGKFFLPEIAGWQRTSLEQGEVVGISNIAAVYEKGEVAVDVSLTGGGGGATGLDGALGSVLGGFARLGVEESGRPVRVGGLPASVLPDGSITVTLEAGSFLTFTSSAFTDQDSALAGMGDLVNAFPVADLNRAAK
jgi:hypothetical protein